MLKINVRDSDQGVPIPGFPSAETKKEDEICRDFAEFAPCFLFANETSTLLLLS
jgi:hypothetical protein